MADPIRPVIKEGKESTLNAVTFEDYPQVAGCAKEGDVGSKECKVFAKKAQDWYKGKMEEMDSCVTGYQGDKHVPKRISKIVEECKIFDGDIYPWTRTDITRTLQACKDKLLGETKEEKPGREEAKGEEAAKKEGVDASKEMGAAVALEEVPDLTPQTLGNAFYAKMVAIFGRDNVAVPVLNGTYKMVVDDLKDYVAKMEGEHKKQYGEFKWTVIGEKTTVNFEGKDIGVVGITPAMAPDEASKKRIEDALKAAKEQVKAELKANYKAVVVTEPADLDKRVDAAENGRKLVELSTELEKDAKKAKLASEKAFPDELAKEIRSLPDDGNAWIDMVKKRVGYWADRNSGFISKYESYLDAVMKARTNDIDSFVAKYNKLKYEIEGARAGIAQDERDDFQDERTKTVEEKVGLDGVQPPPSWDKKGTSAKNVKAFNDWVALETYKQGTTDDAFLKASGYKDGEAVREDLKRISAMEPDAAKIAFEKLIEPAEDAYPSQKVTHKGSLSFKGGFIGGDKKVGSEEETEYAGTILIGEKVNYQASEKINIRAEINAYTAGSTYLPMAEHNNYYGSTKPMNVSALGSLVIAPEYKDEDVGLNVLGVEGPFVDDDIVNGTNIGKHGAGNPLSGAFVFPLGYPSTGKGLRAYFDWDFVKTKDSKEENAKEDTKFKANVFGSLGYYFDQITLNLPTFTHTDDAENVFNGMIGVELSRDVGGLERRAPKDEGTTSRFNTLSGIIYLQYYSGDESVPDSFDPSGEKTTYRGATMLNGGLGGAFRQTSGKDRNPDGFATSAMAEMTLAGKKPTSTSDKQDFAYRLKWEASWNFLLASGVTWTPQVVLGWSSVDTAIVPSDWQGMPIFGEQHDSTNISIFDAMLSLEVEGVKINDTFTGSAKVGGGIIKEYRDEQSALGELGLLTVGVGWK